ncbi:ABC transporter permease [Streptococcus plurextorum]|uniref:ABC transporter permease n=1 Tax=Streptococcus plurextorum TaxID=456876 RepID=UPI0003FF65CB|nr:ABC transporter permease [Streptococcus plurextorum]
MNFLKRAWLSVSRRKGKSLLLFTIIFILGNVIAGAVSIQQATQNVEKTIKTQMGAAATLRPDYDNMSESDFAEMGQLDKETLEKIGALPYVKHYESVMQGSIGASDSVKQYVADLFAEDSFYSSGDSAHYAFMMRGASSSKIIALEEGQITLTSGRAFTDEEVKSGKYVTIISEKLAEMNNLKVGDTATFKNYVMEFGSNEIKTETDYPLEIVGIYRKNVTDSQTTTSDNAEAAKYMKADEEMRSANLIYVPNKVVEDVGNEQAAAFQEATGESTASRSQYIGEPLFVLKNPDDLEKFKQEAQAYLPKFFIVSANSDNYDTIAAPVKSMSKLAGYVLYVAIGATVLIITLVVLLFLRDRKHELGIYLSLGESRSKVVLQTLVEVFMIAIVALTLSVFTGNLIASGLSDTLINSQLNSTNQMGGTVIYAGLSELNVSTTLDDVMSQYRVSLDLGYVLAMYGIGLGTVLLATIIPMTYITRLNPKRIMM